MTTTVYSAGQGHTHSITDVLTINKKETHTIPTSASKDRNIRMDTKLDTRLDRSIPPSGRCTPMPDATGGLPVVKFSYSHYSEQRRRIDRLVQGLPVLSSTSSQNGVNSGVVIYVNGEEPIRSSSKERRSQSPCGGVGGQRCHSRSSSTELKHKSSPKRHRPQSPVLISTKQLPKSSVLTSSQLQNKMTSSEIVVIEDDNGPLNTSGHHKSDNLRSLNNLDKSNIRVNENSGYVPQKYAPPPKIAKARQRMLAGARKSHDHNGMTSSNGFPLAEMTW